jgi:hypothetical protein
MRISVKSIMLVFLMLALSLSVATNSMNGEVETGMFKEAKTVSYSPGEHNISLSLPTYQPGIVLIESGQTSSIEFLIEHTGASSSQLDVVFGLSSPLPSTWADPIWDQPGGYSLSGGGTFARPILSIEVPDGDLTSAPTSLEIEARAYSENTDGQTVEVAIETIVLDVVKSEDLTPPQISVFEDDEHQRQIADSNQSDGYDELLSNYVNSGDVSEDFFIHVFNSGLYTDSFKLRVNEVPDAWDCKFYDNETGMELPEEGIHSLTPYIGSYELFIVRMEVFPPSGRDAQDIGLISFSVASVGDSELSTEVAFTVHRTFDVLVEVTADSDSGTIGNVGPINPGTSLWYQLRVTDSSDTLGQTTWRISNTADLDRNNEDDAPHASWGYSLSNGSESNIVVVDLEAGEHVDIKFDLTLPSKVEAGLHTIYVSLIEEGVNLSEARYFDLPVIVEVGSDVQPGRLELTNASSEIIRFERDEERNTNFTIVNQNNIPLSVVISLQERDMENKTYIRASSDLIGRRSLLRTLPPYSSQEFIVIINSNLEDGNEVAFDLVFTPMNDEVPYDSEYTQIMSFKYQIYLDYDWDGVRVSSDQCPNTPENETVGATGCSSSQLDDDGDGVMNSTDQCPNTPENETVGATGCSSSQLDDDGDGVMNSTDQCPNTPENETVGATGCISSQLDDGDDGIEDTSEGSVEGKSSSVDSVKLVLVTISVTLVVIISVVGVIFIRKRKKSTSTTTTEVETPLTHPSHLQNELEPLATPNAATPADQVDANGYEWLTHPDGTKWYRVAQSNSEWTKFE